MDLRAVSWSLCVTLFVIASSFAFAGEDTDGDGVPDAVDVCCSTPAGTTVDAFGRPIGDLDEDCDVDLQDAQALSLNFTGPGIESQDGNICDDGNACTNNDQLICGVCVGDPIICNDQNSCTNDWCDVASGQCISTPIDGTACSDANLCTIADTCVGGICSGTPKNCNDGNDCTADMCDPTTGSCVNDPQDGLACDDGNACSYADLCVDGSCSGVAVVCDDDNSCTDDSCDPVSGQCINTPNDGAACTDANLCTISDTCGGGICSGTPRNCDDGNDCTADMCDPATGSCVYDPQDGLACDDGLACTVADVCDGAGLCTGSVDCDPMVCEDSACNASGGCDVVLKSGWCRIAGACYLDGDQHPDNSCLFCDASMSSSSWTAVSGSCNDDNDCTYNDSCVAGVCQGVAFSCDDGRTCTIDVCKPSGTCINDYVPLSGECFIQNACVADQGFNPTNDCQFCDAPGTTWSNRPLGTPCADDGNPSTGDVCNGSGVCIHFLP